MADEVHEFDIVVVVAGDLGVSEQDLDCTKIARLFGLGLAVTFVWCSRSTLPMAT